VLDKELTEALRSLGIKMDRIDRGNFYNFMLQQRIAERSTPTNVEFGSYGFNPFDSATVLAEWRQLLPRNSRRRRVLFNAINFTYYFAVNDTIFDISQLIEADDGGFAGTLPVMAATLTGGFIFPIETTGAIWGASITGSGSSKELKSIINWQEEIYSDVDAIPGLSDSSTVHKPGVEGRLTAGLMSWLGDRDDAYSRDGVR
jgi:hypothetical protein